MQLPLTSPGYFTGTIVYYDLETGGLDLKHPIVQLAAVAVRNGEPFDEFNERLRFDPVSAHPDALSLIRYSAEAWRDAKEPAAVVRAFAHWLEDKKTIEMTSKRTGKPYKVARLAGYNAALFDQPRLMKLYKDHDAFLPAHPVPLDVLQLVHWYFARVPASIANHKLGTVCEYLKIPLENAHEALSDVRATARVANHIAQYIRN